MIIKTELEMPDFEQPLEMKALNWEVVQAAREGLEYGRPLLKNIHFNFYDSKLIPYFFEWAKSGNSKRTGKIHYISSDMGKVEYSFSFKDAVCSECHVYFNSMKEAPLRCEVSLSVCLQKQDLVKGKGEKAKVAESAPVDDTTESTPIAETPKPQILEIHYESVDGVIWDNWIDHGDFILCIKSKDAIGSLFSADLNFPNRIIEYQGSELVNSQLENIQINSDLMKIELKSKIKTKGH